MNTPIPSLMKLYNTEDVFLAKTADVEPLLARLGMSILNYELAKSNQTADNTQKEETALHQEAAREHEQARMQPASESLRHTEAPRLIPAGSHLPPGWDEGTVRLASVAAQIGADMAKVGGIGTGLLGDAAADAAEHFGPKLLRGAGKLVKAIPYKGQIAMGAAGLGALALGNKAIHAGTRALGQEAPSAPVYGTPTRGVGYSLPFGVNQYGQPQVGAPLG